MTDLHLPVDSFASVVDRGIVEGGHMPGVAAGRLDIADFSVVVDPIELRLARELHDSVAQIMARMVIDLENFKRNQSGNVVALSTIADLQGSARQVLANLRDVLTDLRKEPKQDEGLVNSIGTLLEAMTDRIGLAHEFIPAADWPRSLPSTTSQHIYRIVEEAVNNACRHGRARTVQVGLWRTDELLVVSVSDDGQGIATVGDIPGSFGITGMRERAALLGGSLELSSNAEAVTGSVVRAVVPLPSDLVRIDQRLENVG